jgi:hypothetical protein
MRIGERRRIVMIEVMMMMWAMTGDAMMAVEMVLTGMSPKRKRRRSCRSPGPLWWRTTIYHVCPNVEEDLVTETKEVHLVNRYMSPLMIVMVPMKVPCPAKFE